MTPGKSSSTRLPIAPSTRSGYRPLDSSSPEATHIGPSISGSTGTAPDLRPKAARIQSEGASGSAEIRGARWVPTDRDVRTLVLRSLHSDLLKDEPEHPRVVHPREKHAVQSRDVLRGEECVEHRLGEVVEVAGRSSKILGSHSEDHLDGELGALGRRSKWGLRIGGRHGVANGLPPSDR